MKFYENLKRWGIRIAVVSQDEKVTYNLLQAEIDCIRSKIKTRTLAFCICTNTIEAIEGYFAFLQSHIPVVLINPQIGKGSFLQLMEIYTPGYIWMPQEYENVNVDIDLWKHRSYVLVKKESEDVDFHEELAVLLTTSGSTGSPKLVRQSYQNICANTESIIEYLKITPNDCVITTLPMYYTYGLSIIQTHIACGASIVLTDAAVLQPEFWELVKKYKVTTFGGVPYTYEMLKKIRFLNRDVQSLRYLTQAGGKLGKNLHFEMADSCTQKGIDFIVMYGQTEATARMSYVPPEHAIDKAGSIGIAIPGGKFWLEDANNNIITDLEEIGELVYQGKNVTMGYAVCREDLGEGYVQGDILHTGDIAQMDEDGYYYIVGRKKRFLKIYGNRVNMDEVEELLKREGFDCAVCGVDDKMKIYVLHDFEMDFVSQYILNNTSIPKFGFSVSTVSEFPRNESGKILYSELEKIG